MTLVVDRAVKPHHKQTKEFLENESESRQVPANVLTVYQYSGNHATW